MIFHSRNSNKLRRVLHIIKITRFLFPKTTPFCQSQHKPSLMVMTIFF